VSRGAGCHGEWHRARGIRTVAGTAPPRETPAVDIFSFFQLCRQVPVALFTGYFQVDERHCVRGFPARLVGLCFLAIVGFAVTATVLSATSDELATPLLFGGFFLFIFCVIVAATVCVACQQKIDQGAERAKREKADDRW